MTPPMRSWLVLCALNAGCSKTDGATRSPGLESPSQTSARGTAGIAGMEPVDMAPSSGPASTAAPRPEVLPLCTETTGRSLGLGGLTHDQVRARFGTPGQRESFRVEERQGEFYGPIANTYPTTDPKNRNVPLEEWTWRSGDCVLSVWFHHPHGTWQVLDDFYWHKDATF